MSVVFGANNDLVFPVRRLAPDGLEAWKQVSERGYEGYVAKDEASVYEGGRSDEAMAEIEAEAVDGRGGRLAAADLRGERTMMQFVRKGSPVVVLLLCSQVSGIASSA